MCHGFRGVPRGAFGLGLKATGKQIEMILKKIFEETTTLAVFGRTNWFGYRFHLT